jgi:hypothetical protein
MPGMEGGLRAKAPPSLMPWNRAFSRLSSVEGQQRRILALLEGLEQAEQDGAVVENWPSMRL